MQLFNITWKWNIPNALSILRILLVPCFAVLYLLHYDSWSFATLALSGLTDALDGFIARHFNQITDCGKLLDPLSDKLTQVAVVICLATRYREILPLAVLCLLKEAMQAIGGIILLRRRSEVRGSKWFGKMYTVVFYVTMILLVLWYDEMVTLAAWLPTALIALVIVTTLWAFFGYMRLFVQISRAEKQQLSPKTEKGESV